MIDCTKAQALLDWLYWTQASAEAQDLAIKYVPVHTHTHTLYRRTSSLTKQQHSPVIETIMVWLAIRSR
jgi:hypothetical protein